MRVMYPCKMWRLLEKVKKGWNDPSVDTRYYSSVGVRVRVGFRPTIVDACILM